MMKSRIQSVWSVLFAPTIVGAGIVAAVLATTSLPYAKEDVGDVALALKNGVGQNPFVVHEWGTFTSFSGSNGVQLDFRPLINEDLPEFVFDRTLQSGIPTFAKSRIRARVRMETPVTYFYTDQERTVQASVEFPEGLLTEFYPPVASMEPSISKVPVAEEVLGSSKLDWGDVHLIPISALAASIQDTSTRGWLQGLIEQRIVPVDANPRNHYFHARETDSALVHVRHAQSAEHPRYPEGDFIEKFLFYRGVGRFEQPLLIKVAEDGQFTMTNSGQQPLRSLFRVIVAGSTINLRIMNELAAGATASFSATERDVNVDELSTIVVDALVREGLYPREALAMVKTWANSWFTEEGTRVFYMLPQEATDKLLPLHISPEPDQTIRVMVGRVEVLPPSVEKHLLEVVRLNAQHRAVLIQRQIEEKNTNPVQLPIPTPLKKLGRLVEPALVRIRELAKETAVSHEATILMEQCREALDRPATTVEVLSQK